MPELTFAGYPLLFDQGGQARSFQEAFQRINLSLPYIAESIWRMDGKEGPVGQSHVGLSMPNYPPPPPPRVNELYWPQGMSRWARGLFLVTTETKDKIVALRGHPQDFVANCGGPSFKAMLYALNPIPISSVTGKAGLWILPLVDMRYWFQFTSVGDLQQADVTSWTSLIDTMSTNAIGVPALNIDSAISPDYFAPDMDEFARRFRNVAQLWDAIAHSVGMRVVSTAAADLMLIEWTSSIDRLEGNLTRKNQVDENEPDRDWHLIAGGDYSDSLIVPKSVDIVFPKYISRMRQRLGRVYTINKTASGRTERALFGDEYCKKTIHTTYWAQYFGTEELTDCTDPAPTNSSDCEKLAEQIADDYYLSIDKAYDYTFLGIKPWYPTGWDDHILYQFGCESDRLAGVAPDSAADLPSNFHGLVARHERLWLTRVVSMPQNFGVEDMLHQTSVSGKQIIFRPLGLDMIVGKVDTEIAGRNGNVLTAEDVPVYYIDEDDDTLKAFKTDDGTQESHSAYNLDLAPLPSGEWITLHKELLSGQKVAQPLGSNFMIGKVKTTAIAAGTTGTVELHSQDWTATGVTYTVYNPHDIELPVDLKVRWGRYPGWTYLVVEPWHFTTCVS